MISAMVDEFRGLITAGIVEFELIAQNLTHDGGERKDGSTTLAALVKELAKIEGAQWFRLMCCYPLNITKEPVELIRNEEKICSDVDILLQYVDDRMPAIMRGRTIDEITS